MVAQTGQMIRLKRANLTTHVYDALKEMITTRQLQPGDRLVPGDLANDMGVSQTPVREALAALVQDGLVTQYQRKSYHVSVVDPVTVKDLYEVRLALDQYIASVIVDRVTDADLDALRQLLSATFDAGTWDADSDSEFHVYLARMTGNTQFLGIYENVETRRRLIGKIAPRTNASPRTVHEEHKAILEALEARDPVALREASTRHNRRSAESFGS